MTNPLNKMKGQEKTMFERIEMENRAVEERLMNEIESEKKFMTFKKFFKILELQAILRG